MAFVHGNTTGVLGAEFDFSSWLNSSEISGDVETAETTTYGKESKTYIAGLADGTISFGGLYEEQGTPDQEAALAAMRQSANGEPWTIGYDGITAGNACRFAKARQTSHAVSAPVGDVVVFSLNVQADGGVHVGTILHGTAAAETGAGNTTSTDDGASSSDGAVATLHLLSFTGTSIDVTVQDSANDSTWVDLISFASLTAAGAEFAEVTGTVDRYIRCEWSGTFSSATFAVAFSRA